MGLYWADNIHPATLKSIVRAALMANFFIRGNFATVAVIFPW